MIAALCSVLVMLGVDTASYDCPQTDTVATYNGYVEIEPLRLAPSSSGRITQLNVDTGDNVQQGQVLFTLDTESERTAVRMVASPQEGQIVKRYYQQGEWVAAGAPVISLLANTQYKIRFFLPETQLGAVQIGDSIQVQCDGCTKPQLATIRYIAPSPEFTSPVLYTQEQRAKLVYLVEAKPSTKTTTLHAGQPVTIQLISSVAQP